MFAGNEFLPRLPSLEINENALDLLIHVYKAEFKNMGGYLVDTTQLKEKKAAFVKAERVEKFIQAVGRYENKILMKRYNLMQAKLKRIMRQRMETEAYDSESLVSVDKGGFESAASQEVVELSSLVKTCKIRNNTSEEQNEEIVRNTKELFQSLKKCLQDKGDLFKNEIPSNDKIRLGQPGWEDRYYREKFSLETCSEIQVQKKELVQKYTEGLCWTLTYYYSGVCSWQWYYPFHYAPFASDLNGMPWSSVSFILGKPIKPFEQLLSVLPPRSAPALPEAYGKLMTCKDSILALFYPNDFEVDMFGKRFLWQGVVKLPFIQEGLVVAEARKHENDLKDEEKARNSVDCDRIFMPNSHCLASEICSRSCGESSHGSSSVASQGSRDSRIQLCMDGMNGYLCSSADRIGRELTQGQRRFPSPIVGMEDIEDDAVICFAYFNPDPHDHVPRLLEGVDIPEKMVTASDIEWRPLWHEHHGSRPPADATSRPIFGRGNARGTAAAERHGSHPPADVTSRRFFGRGSARGTAAAAAATAGNNGYGRSSCLWRPKYPAAPHSSSFVSASVARGRAAGGNAYSSGTSAPPSNRSGHLVAGD